MRDLKTLQPLSFLCYCREIKCHFVSCSLICNMISSTSITDSLYLQCFELLWWYVNVLAWTYFYYLALSRTLDFPGSSTGKESTCNAGDTGSIPGSGRSSGEGIGYPLQCSWWLPPPVFLVAQTVKNLLAMWETWLRSLGWEDPLQESMQPTLVFLPGECPWTEGPGGW